MKILASTDLRKVYDIADEMCRLLDENHIMNELWDYKPYPEIDVVGVVDIYIDGDWKHDHLRADYLIKENFTIFKAEERVTEDTGADWYPAVHTYYVSLR